MLTTFSEDRVTKNVNSLDEGLSFTLLGLVGSKKYSQFISSGIFLFLRARLLFW